MPTTLFKKGNPGKPKGAICKKTSLKNLLEQAFEKNHAQAKKMLDGMFTDEKNFKWICEIKASLEPKEVNAAPELTEYLMSILSKRNSPNAPDN